MPNPTVTAVLHALEPVVETSLHLHLATAQEWFPHQYGPWNEGTNFDGH